MSENTNVKSTNRKIEKSNRKIYIQVNFLIIRIVFNLIKTKSISNRSFYSEIIDAINPINFYDTLTGKGIGDYKNYAQRLNDYNIPIDYFSDRFIEADQKIIDVCKAYLSDKTITPIEECNNVIEKYIFSIKNPDGSLLVDCIFNIIQNIQSDQLVNDIDDLAENIVETTPTTRLTLKQIIKYYNSIAESYSFDEDGNLKLPDIPTSNMSDRNFYTIESNTMSFNLFLIKEFYRFFANIDDIHDYMEKFYNYLSVTESEYNEIINNGTIPTRELLKKLVPFKYPASCFRSDTPVSFKISNSLERAYGEYLLTQSIETFRDILRLDICYRKDIVYFPLVISTYSLIRHIELYNSFGGNSELLENYIKLRNDYNHQE